MESEANREQSSTPNNTSPLSKSEAIASLKQTIQQLEEIVTQLKTIESTDLVEIDSPVNTLVTTTKKLATAITTTPTPQISASQPPQAVTEEKPKPQTDISSPSPSPIPTQPDTPKPQLKKSLAKRNNKLVIGVISALIIIGVGIFWWWLPEKPVALVSRNESTATEITLETTPKESETIEPEVESEIYPEAISDTSVNPDALENSTENLISDTESEPEISEIDIPLELEAPAASKQLKLETVEPEIILTPEQNLIAAIQNRVTEITKDYAEDSIVSVEADFRQGSLSVILSNLWYELSESRQNKLANDILKRSRQLDFQKLTINDTKGTLIARNPVIGNSAIILKRSINQE